ncbi:MAG: hypothetical protein RMJ33_09345 [Saprospiraceae bacterium]|nr:hypothetical protein [Saprospiraceae bacterium]MDW8230028.1 hypothetical protein [Saprospiraceae bacterium]
MNYIQIGFTRKTHGIHGEVKAYIEESFEDLFLESERIFLEIRGIKHPFFIKSIRGGGELIVGFEDINTREDALRLQSRPIFLPENEVPVALLEAQQTTSPRGHLVGYLLVDQQAGTVGVIQEVLEMPQQEMAVVLYQGREVLIPLAEALIVATDDAQKQLLMNLPEGLLTL